MLFPQETTAHQDGAQVRLVRWEVKPLALPMNAFFAHQNHICWFLRRQTQNGKSSSFRNPRYIFGCVYMQHAMLQMEEF